MYQTLNTLHISESAVAQNISYYQLLHPSSLIAPVVKANAYGHGLIDMANIYQRMGQIMLCVDSVYESQQIRMYSGYTGDILVMGYTMPQNLAYKDMKGLHFVAYDMETIETLYREHVDPKIHLKLDTGMNRQGIKLEDLDDFLVACQQISGFRLEGLCSHLYDADNPDGHLSLSHSHQQLERFLQGLSIVRWYNLEPNYKHIQASSGALILSHPELNMLRLGLGQYGVSPIEKYQEYHTPVLTWNSTIVQVKDLKKGDVVSYNGIFTALEDMRIAVVPAGYYEGIPRSLSSIGSYKIHNQIAPILGRVCMNITVVDITDIDGVCVGDSVEIISPEALSYNSIISHAQKAETIPYEIMTGLSESIRRVVK